MSFQHNRYTESIFEFFQSGEGNAFISACAGSGKTTTLVELLKNYATNQSDFPDEMQGAKILFVAFSNKISDELKERLPQMSNVTIRTFHSLGRSILKQYLSRKGVSISLNKKKYSEIVSREVRSMAVSGEDRSLVTSTLIQLIQKVRITNTDPNDRTVMKQIAIRYDLDIGSKNPDLMSQVLDVIPHLIEKGNDMALHMGAIDYSDMIYLPVHWGIKPDYQYDLVFVDEAQDLSDLTRRLVYDLARSDDGRAFFVGDDYQSIMAFAGAEIDSVSQTIDKTQASVFPLHVCYRCPQSHINIARGFVKHITPRPGAEMGVTTFCEEGDLPFILKPGDMVLSRFTAPLISLAISLALSNIPAYVRGQDIAASLNKVLRDIDSAVGGIKNMSQAVELVKEWASERIAYLRQSNGNDDQITAVFDKRDALISCIENMGATSISQLCDSIDALFKESVDAIMLTTIHKAKGLESERVFILDINSLPYIREGMPYWVAQQEVNLLYVALTRSRSFLGLVGTPDAWENYMGKITSTHDKKAFMSVNHPTEKRRDAPSSAEKSPPYNLRDAFSLTRIKKKEIVEYYDGHGEKHQVEI